MIFFLVFVRILANISGNVINYSDVVRSLSVSQPTARDYFEIADGTFLWRTIAPYTRNTLKCIVKHPKGYFRDSGLLHSLLRIPDMDLLRPIKDFIKEQNCRFGIVINNDEGPRLFEK